jgi:hypothetical protein
VLAQMKVFGNEHDFGKRQRVDGRKSVIGETDVMFG